MERDEKKTPSTATGAEKSGGIIWRDAGARTLRADLTEASTGREEISLTFGVGRPSPEDAGELTGELLARIVMTPFMTKRLAFALDATLQRHESLHGPIWPDARGVNHRAPEKAMREKGLLLSLANELRVELGSERSFKVFKGIILTDRFLLSAPAGAVPREKILDVCRRLGLPDPFWAPLLQNLPDAKFVHFGFEDNEKSSVYKVYLELHFKSRHYPFLIYMGFKWDTADTARHALARYTCYPSFITKDIMEKLSLAFAGPDAEEAAAIAQGIVGAAVKVAPEIFYVETTEDGNPRKSFDMNLYDAALTLGSIEPLLMRMGDHYGLPREQFAAFIDGVRAKRLGHLTGGIDREGRDFFTVHFGVEER